MGKFTRKNILITGASEGVGAEVARLFWREGANLILAARRPDPLNQLKQKLQAGATSDQQSILCIPTDVSDFDQCKQLITELDTQFDGLDILVNNAGFNQRGNFAELGQQDIDNIIAVNLQAPAQLINLAMPLLSKKASPKNSSKIINVASLAGVYPMPGEALYSASKFALRAFSTALRQELRHQYIDVCLVSPGTIKTQFLLSALEEVPDYVFSQPMSTAKDIAQQIVLAATTGKAEYLYPKASGILAKIGYQFPFLNDLFRPILDKKGRTVKANLLQKLKNS